MSCRDALSRSWASTLSVGSLCWGVHIENVYRLGLDIKTAFDIRSWNHFQLYHKTHITLTHAYKSNIVQNSCHPYKTLLANRETSLYLSTSGDIHGAWRHKCDSLTLSCVQRYNIRHQLKIAHNFCCPRWQNHHQRRHHPRRPPPAIESSNRH